MRTQSFLVRIDFVYNKKEGIEPLTNSKSVKEFIEEDVHMGNYTIVSTTDAPYIKGEGG